MLNNIIGEFLDNNNKISNIQMGFRKNQRIADHLLLIKTLIDIYKAKGKHIFACFVNLSSAFCQRLTYWAMA